MDIDLGLKLAVIVLLLVLSAFFSSVESAFFSLSRSALDRLRESSDSRAKRAARLMDNPRRLLATILTGNTIVNTAAAALAALAAADLALRWDVNPNLAVTLEILLVSGIILFFSELTPKLLALRNPEKWAVQSSGGLAICRVLLMPLAEPLAFFSATLARVLGIKQHNVLALSEEEIRALVQVGHAHGALELEERRMIHSIFEFGDTIVREVMVPRIDVVAVDLNVPLEELLQLVDSRGHSRIPVFNKTIDNIVGVIHAKDLLQVTQNPSRYDLSKLSRPAYYVPEEKKIDDLLREFQTQKVHMAIVVDEYGGTAGLVTLEDIIEEIVGEIQDEYDSEQPLIKKLDNGDILVSGRIGTYDLNEMQGVELVPDSEAYDTLAGFIYSSLGHVPKKGEGFEHKGYRFVVDEVHGKRIIRVRIVREKGVLEDV
ncbi:MAG: hemolysin family protein [Calditrichota bacterium]